MEWTGQRYADGPTVSAETYIDAPPEHVWALVGDIHLMPRLSTEVVAVEWLDGADGPAVGRRFTGASRHDALGEWRTTSYVVECERPHRFAWAVQDAAHPTATWRFTLRPDGGGTVLEQWVRTGPAPSGLSRAIDRMPDKEQKIVFVRMREFEAGIRANLAAIKELAERPGTDPAEPSDPTASAGSTVPEHSTAPSDPAAPADPAAPGEAAR